MRQTILIFSLTAIFSCSTKLKQQAPVGNNLPLPELSVINTRYPLTLSNISLQDSLNIVHLNDEIENKISQTIYSYYFNDCSGDSSETNFKIKDTYIGTLRLHDSLQTLYLVILHFIPTGQVNSKILFYDNSSKQFANKVLDFNLHALYDYNERKLTPTNLRDSFKLHFPEIELVDYDKDGKNDFKLTRLYHNGTTNAIETTVLRVANNKIDTLNFNQKTIRHGTDNP